MFVVDLNGSLSTLCVGGGCATVAQKPLQDEHIVVSRSSKGEGTEIF